MCKVYNSIGSLKAILSHLQQHGVTEFNSLQEIMNFQKGYPVARRQVFSTHELLIEEEKIILSSAIIQTGDIIKTKKIEFENDLRTEITDLKEQLLQLSTTPKNVFQKLITYFKKQFLIKKIKRNEINLDFKVYSSVQHLGRDLAIKNNRLEYINSQFADAVNDSCAIPLAEIDRKKRIIDEVNKSIYGALGEEKVVKELEKLTDECYLINDLSLSFSKPIYNRQENDYIKSIQIDHALISPAGIFLIETKNWSEHSLTNLSLRSPVQQIKRTSFALFRILTNEIARAQLKLNHHHWGDRKIPIRNFIIMIHIKPNEEFQYVKILTLKELRSYVNYFKPVFTSEETEEIANYLIRLNRLQVND